MEKKITFLIQDNGIGETVLGGDIDQTLDYLKAYITELNDGEVLVMPIIRKDMTQEEIDTSPEI